MAALAKTHLVDVDTETGALIQGWARIRQSIVKILTTRLRTRLMRLWWGSSFIDLQDKPLNEEVMMTSIMAAVQAINKYEPEFKITDISLEGSGSEGSVQITINGVDLIDLANRRVTLAV